MDLAPVRRRATRQARSRLSSARSQRRAGEPKDKRKILYWYDPMHPAYKSDKPGIAPDCGMDLVPKYADEAGAGDSGRNRQRSRPPSSS